MKDSVKDVSYAKHAQSYASVCRDGVPQKEPEYLNPDGDSYWKIKLHTSPLLPILAGSPGASWITIGDGRYGSEAFFITKHDGKALATDIAEDLLRIAKEKGYIADYAIENAEALTFADDSFDYACCRESAHHFPRPYTAIYEMLRVAKEAVVLIEPADPFVCWRESEVPLTLLRALLNVLLGGHTKRNDFERAGNYLYRFSVREMEKIAMGIGLPAIAVKGVNTFFFWGSAPATSDAARHRQHTNRVRRFTRLAIAIQDVMTRLRLLQPVMYAFVLFKKMPTQEIRHLMEADGYIFLDLPKHPYAN